MRALTPAVRAELRAELAGAQREICGLVVESADGEQRWWPLVNLDRRRDRFAIDPRQLARVARAAEETAFTVVALVHSHVARAELSAVDRVAAAASPWPWLVVVAAGDDLALAWS